MASKPYSYRSLLLHESMLVEAALNVGGMGILLRTEAQALLSQEASKRMD